MHSINSYWYLVLVLTISLGYGCNQQALPDPVPEQASSTSTTKVELALNWFPEIEHGGYYTALIKGYYKEAGLDVNILAGGPDAPVIQRLTTNQVQFGVANADNVIFAHASSNPIVALMAPIQHSPRCLLVHADSTINNFADLKDITLAMNDSNAFAHYLRFKIPLTNVQVVRYTGSIALFLDNPNMVQQAYNFSEPVIASKKGVRTRQLMLSDLGFDPYTSLLVTNADIINKKPELVTKFVQASQRGWQEYIQNPAETNKYINSLNPEIEVDILNQGTAELVPLCQQTSATDSFGSMTTERFQTLLEQMMASKVIEQQDISVVNIMTNKFLSPVANDAIPTKVSEP